MHRCSICAFIQFVTDFACFHSTYTWQYQWHPPWNRFRVVFHNLTAYYNRNCSFYDLILGIGQCIPFSGANTLIPWMVVTFLILVGGKDINQKRVQNTLKSLVFGLFLYNFMFINYFNFMSKLKAFLSAKLRAESVLV